MRQLRTLTALAATASVALAAAPAAFARTSGVGHSSGSPTMNVCAATIKCTYFNTHNGKPTDVVKRSGTVTDWSVNAGSAGGQVRLRILRPSGGGNYTVVRSSSVHTVKASGLNTFSANVKVRAGDVLALGNGDSGLYMENADPGNSVHYYMPSPTNGASGKPNQVTPDLHLLLSAHVKS
jgi:hypothetical protein